MAVRISTIKTDALIRHLEYSGAVPDVALFLRRAVDEQAQSIRNLAEAVRSLEARINEIEGKGGKSRES